MLTDGGGERQENGGRGHGRRKRGHLTAEDREDRPVRCRPVYYANSPRSGNTARRVASTA
ncbi:hypothetical protein ALMP_60650 [Streptomyces sp. A012304]|nr:hypothetical protein ALMP_60650 [Streptomyces sp. A012304]